MGCAHFDDGLFRFNQLEIFAMKTRLDPASGFCWYYRLAGMRG